MFITFALSFEDLHVSNDIIRIRQLEGAQIFDTINCAAISERFFNRSRAWFIQRLNNNIVNRNPVSFTPDELLKLRASLKILASEITQFTYNIPNIPTDMSIKVYVIDDPMLIDFIQESDIDGFRSYLDESKEEDNFILFGEPECFDTEAEALAFCSGIGYGYDERGPIERYPLRSCEESDLPFIAAIENY
ncbi:MAG: DUF5053 domain-containing protein [Muribaculaceae bacterium]|nr:DUF5053 domain-containing protein [Muribaculaceae bacterium]